MAHNIQRLEDKCRGLDQALAELAGQKVGGRLGGIVHGPGWTTIAEFALVEANLDSLHAHVALLARQVQELTAAAGKVGQE
jgi:hypothetical protein